MNRKNVVLVMSASLFLILSLMLWHKSKVESKYENFQVQNVQVRKEGQLVALSENISVTVLNQHHTSRNYHATLRVDSRKDSTLSLSHWYLYEGDNRQPNQFLDTNIKVNRKASKALRKGSNLVRISNNVDPKQSTHYLAIVINHPRGKYRVITFDK